MKFAWKLHASQQSFNLLGSPCGDKPLLMYPDFLQIFTALSFPDRSEATDADTTVSSPTNRLSLFAKIGCSQSCFPARIADRMHLYPLSKMFVKGRTTFSPPSPTTRSFRANSSCLLKIALCSW